jgi:hypothetical protein
LLRHGSASGPLAKLKPLASGTLALPFAQSSLPA